MDQDKIEIQKQWDTDPCGAVTVQDREPESLEFYRAVRDHRYREYGPWFDRVMGFDNWRNKDVLEVGVGLGSDHYRFAVNGNRMTALDLSQEHLRHTVKHLGLEGLRTDTHLGDAENMPFADARFDLVYSFGVLHHTPDTERSIAQVYRVLRPGGTAIIGLYHRDSYFYWLSTLLFAGVLKGGLLRKSYRRLMSEIEYRADADSAMPIVKVYSRSGVRRLFRQFRTVELKVCHVQPGLFQNSPKWVRPALEKYFGWFGWYVVAFARK